MRILHTSDWHLGKNLDGYSRIQEQEQFLEEFVSISHKNNPHLILISGDIYDNPNPPAIAQSMFYDSIKKASNNGDTMIIIIPGNHDSAVRLSSAKSLAKESGIILVENHSEIIKTGTYGNNRIIESDKGVIKVDIRGEIAVIITIPFISESALGKSITDIDNTEEENATTYQNTLEEFIAYGAKMYEEDSINLLMAHLFTVKSELSGDERATQLGSSYIIDSKIFPENAHYIALGHIHKFQQVSGTKGKAYYSGSPIHYSKSEAKTKSKYIIQIDINDTKEVNITPIPLTIYKKIDIWQVKTYQEALEMSLEKSEENSWVYIEIEESVILTPDEISSLKKNKKDIIDIKTRKIESVIEEEVEDMKEKSEEERFSIFYEEVAGEKISEELLDVFMYFLNKEIQGE